MDNHFRKDYFNFGTSIAFAALTIIFIIGQILFITLMFIFLDNSFGVKGNLVFGFGVFGMLIFLLLIGDLFICWKYWIYDEDGITNGNLFVKRKILFSEMDYYEIKLSDTGSKFLHKCICFYKGKKMVSVRIDFLSEEELQWLKSKTKPKNDIK